MLSILLNIRRKIRMVKMKKKGMVVGENVHIGAGVVIDPDFCELISIGNNVTIAWRTIIMAHDASTKKYLGFTRIDKVKIEDNVFIGAGCIILPGAKIESNTIIGAGSVVASRVISSGVYIGNPLQRISNYEEYIEKKERDIALCRGKEEAYPRYV